MRGPFVIGSASRRRAVLTVVDQAISSGSTFATGVAVARLSGIRQFGQFAVVVVLWLMLVGLHRALLTEPMVVTGRATDDLRARLADGLAASAVFGAGASAVVAASGAAALAAGNSIGGPMLVLALCLPPLLVQDYWRAMAFQQARPGLALSNDLVFVVSQAVAIVAFAAAGWRTVGYMIGAWGLGGLAGAAYGIRRFPTISRPADGRRMLRRLWPQSRLILADFATGYFVEQSTLLLAAVLLSAVDYGGLRAAYALIGPILILLLAEANLGLPEAARRAETGDPEQLRHFAQRLDAATFACVAAYGLAAIVAGKTVLRVVYGPRFAAFSPLVTLAAVAYMMAALANGQSIALKATGRMRLVWRARLLVGAASLTSLVVLVGWLGVVGVGWASVVTGASWAVAMRTVYYLELTRPATIAR